MIDKLVLQIPFSDSIVSGSALSGDDVFACPFSRDGVYSVDPKKLPFRLSAREIFRNDQGEITDFDLMCPWDSLASSHSGLAIKPFILGNGKQCWPYLELKCSPAKLAQGHNVFGTDDLQPCVENMLFVLSSHYPEIANYINIKRARISEIDITYSSIVNGKTHQRAIIDVLRHTSKGQTKNRGDSYETTTYFGARRGPKRIKIYLKGPEILLDIKDRQRKKLSIPPESVINLAQKLVRFEVTLKRDWLERRAIPVNLGQALAWFDPEKIRALFAEAVKDLIKALDGEDMTISHDGQVIAELEKVHGDTRGRVARLMGFYQGLKSVGYEGMKRQHPDRTFRRYVTDLEACGFSRAYLQSLHEHGGATVLSFPQLVRMEWMDEPAPPGYLYPLLADAV